MCVPILIYFHIINTFSSEGPIWLWIFSFGGNNNTFQLGLTIELSFKVASWWAHRTPEYPFLKSISSFLIDLPVNLCRRFSLDFVASTTTNFPSFPGGSAGKESTCNVGELSSIPGLGKSVGEGNGYTLWYSDLETVYPWGHKQSDTTEQLSKQTNKELERHIFIFTKTN